jgi:DNA-binding MarR family transcriptional regulator
VWLVVPETAARGQQSAALSGAAGPGAGEPPAAPPDSGDLAVAELTAVIEEFNTLFIRLPSTGRLSFTTLSVLHTLSRRSPLRLSELTATEQVTQPAITQLVTRLEQDGLVERRPDPGDRRAVLVLITPAGTQLVAARRAERVARLAALLGQISPADRQAIAAALPALRRVTGLDGGSPARP